MLQGGAALGGAMAVPGWAAPPWPSRDQRLWYARPAQAWTEALPVGNGRLGAMVFGGTTHERLQLNEDTLWNGGPYDPVNPDARAALPHVRELIFANRWAEAEALAGEKLMARPLKQMAYQPVGDLLIDIPGAAATVTGYRRELDLDAAMATTRFTLGKVAFTREVVVSPIDQVIALRLSANRRGAIDCDISLRSPQSAVEMGSDGPDLVLAGRNASQDGVEGALRFEARLAAMVADGEIHHRADGIAVRRADEVTLLLAIATSYRRFDDIGGDPAAITRRQIAAARGKSFGRIAAETAGAHRALFRRVRLDLGRTPAADRPTDQRIAISQASADPALAALYFDYGRYLLICSSRPGTQPANLQGIWNDSTSPPWESKYTININTEMNYWPAEPLAHAEMRRAAGGAREGPRRHRGEDRARDVRRARLGRPSQHRLVARHGADRRRAMGPVADRRRVALPAFVEPL
jgi:alpha-L-fucosidase 2